MILLKIIFIVSVLQVARSHFLSRGFSNGRRGHNYFNNNQDVGGRKAMNFRNGSVTDGLCITSCLTSNAFTQAVTTNNLILQVEDITNALIEAPEGLGQEIAVYLTIVLVGELSDSISVDGCDFVNLVNAFREYIRSGYSRNLKLYLFRFVKRFEEYIDNVLTVAGGTPVNIMKRTTVRGSCAYGRQYHFDEAWNLLDEIVYYEYTDGYLAKLRTAAKNLATSSSLFLNTLGTALTASSPLAYLGLFTDAVEPLVDFLYSVASCGGDPAALAQTAKETINRSFLRIYIQL